jgi:septum formation protein
MSSITSKLTIKAPLLLVSKSPRRLQLLAQAGYQFEPFSLETSEIIDENLNCFDQCKGLACLKMKHFMDVVGLEYKNFYAALTCDTMVEFDHRALGKPKDLAEAKEMLMSYQGKSQKVHTGCCLMRLDGSGENRVWVTSTEVFFKDFSEEEVDQYLVGNISVLSKAGGYGIQDQGFDLVERIHGSYTNIVGLPLEDLSQNLEEGFKNE